MNLSVELPTPHRAKPAPRKATAWWQRLRQALQPDRRPLIGLQPVGVAERDLPELRRRVDELGQTLGLRLDLSSPDAAVVVLDVDFAGRAPKAIVQSQLLGRPALMFERAESPENQRAELLRQLMLLPAVTRHLGPGARPLPVAAHSPAPTPQATARKAEASTLPPPAGRVSSGAFDPDFDSQLQAEQLLGLSPTPDERALVSHVLRGLQDEGTEVLTARYGALAVMRMDFAARLVSLDPRALQGLRVRRELPRRGDGAALTDQAVVHDLDEIVWHLGMACGRHVLLDQPADPWHAPLVALSAEPITRYTRQPRHLELMRALQQGPVSPSVLRRQVRIGVADLRCFLQACLFLGLIRWDSGGR